MKKHANGYTVKNHNLLICGGGLGFLIHIALAFVFAAITGNGRWFENGWLMFISFVIGVIFMIWYTFKRLKRAQKHAELMDSVIDGNLSDEAMSRLREFDEREAKKEKLVNVVKWIVLAVAIAFGLLLVMRMFKEAGF